MVMPGKEELPMAAAGRGSYPPAKIKNNNWKRRKFVRRNDVWNQGPFVGGYVPPRLTDLQHQNKMKTKRFFPRKLRAPRAPRNTSSFIMRSKGPGGLASLVSPVTPAILPTPVKSPAPRYREGLVDEVNKEWGVDGYGSMNGLIRLRSMEEGEKFDSGGGTGDSESDVEHDTHAESVQQLEERIDHGLSRFEIVYPSEPVPARNDNNQYVDVRMEELEQLVAQLEDENLSLKENVYLLQQELAEAHRNLQQMDRGDSGSDENGVCSEKSAVVTCCAQE